MARRAEDIFESMSELITTLAASLLKLKAGGLILIVMLLLGLTREVTKTPETGKSLDAGKKATGEKSTRELFQRLTVLELETARVNAEIEADEQKLKALDKQADEVIEKVGSSKTPDKK